nr:EOG090X0F7F [Lepidurus arcticus]
MEQESSTTTVSFKKANRKNLRKRKLSTNDNPEEAKPEESSDESEDLLCRSKLEETKERQKLRQKPHGVNIISLAIGKRVTLEEEILARDPFRISSGGMVDMQALKSGKVKQNDDAYDSGIGTQFSAETNTRDEDAEMMKYIEQQLAKTKGQDKEKEEEDTTKKYLSPEEAALQAVPEFLRKNYKKQSEEMLSNQMLSGIPEVDLGIEVKIKNIEATEDAKQKLLLEKMRKKDGPSQFVPTNYAVNFIQHNRFTVTDQNRKKKVVEKVPEVKTQITHVVGGEVALPVSTDPKKKDETQKATDDFYFEKFRRQFRR